MKQIYLLLLLLPFYCLSQEEYKIAKFKNPGDEINAEIRNAENSIKKGSLQIWVRTEKIVCLSGITPKESTHQYAGISYKPTLEDINNWKSWLKKNRKYLKYIKDAASDEQLIVFHHPKKQIKLSDCITKQMQSH